MRTAEALKSLDILLNDIKVGTLVRTPGDFIAFNLADEYRANGGLPVLSLSLRSASGGLRKDPRPVQGRLPPFFANLLPEDQLREAMEKHHAGYVRPGNDFDLLVALGGDLPGAVRAVPGNQATIIQQPVAVAQPKARFSLAGVQMKLSVMKNTGKGAGLSIPLDNRDGQYIAKFPSTTFPAMSENEFALLALAQALGLNVPPRELVSRDQFDGIPDDFHTLNDGLVLLVERFDRQADGVRIHTEDFAQVFDLPPSRKYDGAAYHDIASVLNRALSLTNALEFVQRLALCAVMGNGDMHLKNWSLIYHNDGRQPELAPVYDMLSTVPYIPADKLALSLGGKQAFKSLTPDRWELFAHRAGLPKPAVLNAVSETARQINDIWWKLPERDVIPTNVLKRIDTHVGQMVQILSA